MIDRPARENTRSAIEAFLDDQIAAFELDDRLGVILTDDATVNYVIQAVWYHYDDIKDHKITLAKNEWDYFQRLLLLLDSDAEITIPTSKRWSWDHALAWFSLLLFLGIAYPLGWGFHLFLVALPFGIVSMLIAWYRQRTPQELSPRDIAHYPFASFSQIRSLRLRAPEFAKRQYRSDIAGRQIRTTGADSLNRMASLLPWLFFSPLALFFQGIPTRISEAPRLIEP